VLLTKVDKGVLKEDLGLRAFGTRSAVLEVIHDLRQKSVKYANERDEIDGPRLSISPKKFCQEDPLLKLAARVSEIPNHLLERAERAIKRRARILKEIKPISQLPDAAELSYVKLLCAAAQLSNPAIQIKFPFPFVGDSIPKRFNYDGDHGYWDYVGREKFAELVDATERLHIGEAISFMELLATENPICWLRSHII